MKSAPTGVNLIMGVLIDKAEQTLITELRK
jgi:hypothetical protein